MGGSNRLVKALGSARLAAWLISALGAFLLLGFIVPQRAIVGDALYDAWLAQNPVVGRVIEALGLDAIFSTPVFATLIAVLAVNVVMCTLSRMTARKRRATRVVSEAPADSVAIPLRVPAEDVDRALRAHMRGRWRVLRPSEQQWVVEGGVAGYWGSVVMHAGLTLAIVAGLVSALTRFSGTVLINEGQTITDAADSFAAVSQLPRLGPGFTGASITLERLEFAYQGETIVDSTAFMTSDRAARGVHEVHVNQPLRAAGKAYLLKDAGYSVGLRVTRGDQVLLDSFVSLGNRVPEGFSDEVTLADGTTLRVTAVPDAAIAPGESASRVMVLRDPEVRLAVAGSAEGASVRPQQAVPVGGLNVSVKDVRFWHTFMVRADKGLPIMYWAFAVILLGVAVRWIDPDAAVGVLLADDGETGAAFVWSRSRLAKGTARRAQQRVEAVLAAATQDGGV